MRFPFRFLFVTLFVFNALVMLASVGRTQGAASDLPPAPQIQQVGPHNTITIRAAGLPGHYAGFDVLADDLLVAPVRFTSHDLIFCAAPVIANNGLTSTLTFDDLQTAPDFGLKLTHSRIVITLRSQQYPTVAFDLRLAAFDANQWQNALGLQPFHFLTIGMPDATVWHQEGWLFAAPRADLFPLLLDVHQGATTLAATYNHEWSRTPPLSAHPLPVIGLWSPAHKLYAAWDFQDARLTDHSERDIATGFCNRLIVSLDPEVKQTQETVPPSMPIRDTDAPQSQNGQPPRKRDPRTRKLLSYAEQTSREFDQRGVSKFVALVYPSGNPNDPNSDPKQAQNNAPSRLMPVLAPADGSLRPARNYQQLTYPAPNAHIASHATLMFRTNLSDTEDPNRFLWQRWWDSSAVRARLSHVPRVNDLGRIPAIPHSEHLAGMPEGSLLSNAQGDFQTPGSLLLSGWNWQNESAVDAPAQQGDKARLARLQADAQTLLKYARHFWVDKEPCVYWEQPLAGEYTPNWGGEAATTLHNANGWAAGRLLLDLYRIEREDKRDKIKDKSAKAEGEAAAIQNPKSEIRNHSASSRLSLIDGVFNWAKHSVWTRGDQAELPAVPSARSGAPAIAFLLDYYFTFKDDLVDGAHRTRAIQALDLARSFAYRYMILWTGDSGSSDNRHSAFEWQPIAGAETAPMRSLSTAASSLDALAQTALHTGDPILLWALQGSLARNNDSRQNAALNDDLLPSLLDPAGSANARVLCGERAALAFERGAQNLVVTDYHCTHPGDFAFTLRRLGTTGLQTGKDTPLRLVVTFPYADLSRKAVAVRRGSISQRTLQPGVEVVREKGVLWSLIVNGLHNGDTVLVGDPNLNAAETLPSAPPLIQDFAETSKRFARP